MSTAKAGKRPLRSLTAHEKLSAIKRVSVGGESKASVARDIGVPESTLRGWCKNQEKISYQVRTSPSSPEEPTENLNYLPAKRRKLQDDQPYNLSMKSSDVSNCSYSPNSEANSSEYPKSDPENSPLNLRTTKNPESQVITTTTPKTNIQTSEKDRQENGIEKNRGELDRLAIELGLDVPEVLMSSFSGSNNFADLTAALVQWRTAYQSWYYQQQQQKVLQQQPNVKPTIAVDTKMVPATSSLPQTNGGLLTTVDKRDKITNIEQQPTVYDSVSYWLRQQSLLNLSSQPSTISTATSNAPPVTSTAGGSTTTSTSLVDQANQQLRLWSWYQQNYGFSQLRNIQPMVQPEAPPQAPQTATQQPQILYHQLTKNTNERDVNSENDTVKEDKPKIVSKNRSVLDNLLLNNNSISCDVNKEEDYDGMDAQEAIENGEKFLHWLENCSDPSVTTLQLHTVQSLIKNLKSGLDRKSDQSRNKVRRK